MTKIRKMYIDIEVTYCGDINPNKSQEDRERFFKDYVNWKFFTERCQNGKKIEYQGIIGILVLEFEVDENTQVHKIINKKFVQLIGREITKERLMKELDGVNEIIGYHCRTKPSGEKGYVGFDFGIIGAQLGVILDELDGIKCTDLELLCHSAGMYGGLKKVEMLVPGIPPRKSGVMNGEEEEKLLLDIAVETDENKKKELWDKAKRYNREDTTNLVYIEHYLKKLKIIE